MYEHNIIFHGVNWNCVNLKNSNSFVLCKFCIWSSNLLVQWKPCFVFVSWKYIFSVSCSYPESCVCWYFKTFSVIGPVVHQYRCWMLFSKCPVRRNTWNCQLHSVAQLSKRMILSFQRKRENTFYFRSAIKTVPQIDHRTSERLIIPLS